MENSNHSCVPHYAVMLMCLTRYIKATHLLKHAVLLFFRHFAKLFFYLELIVK